MVGNISVELQEQNLLKILTVEPQKMHEVNGQYFVSSVGKTLYNCLKNLYENHVEITPTTLAIEVGKHEVNVSENTLKSVIFDKEIGNQSFDYLNQSLIDSYIRNEMQSTFLKDGISFSTSKEAFDINKLLSLRDMLTNHIDLWGNNRNYLYTIEEAYDLQIAELEKRKFGEYYFSTGDPSLDEVLTTGFEPGYVNILYAHTGLGKTTYKLYLENRHIEFNMPLLSISTELRLSSTMDKLLCMRHKIPMDMLYPNSELQEEIPEFIFEKIKADRQQLMHSNKIRIVDKPDLTLDDVEGLIRKARSSMGLKPTENLLVSIDLFTLLKDFSGDNKASRSEDAMNKLHMIMRRNNSTALAVIQSKRQIEKVKVKTIEDLDKFRPTTEEIKNSGAFEERARVVLALYRAKFFASKTLSHKPEMINAIPDVAEVSVLKQNFGSVGNILKYYFEGSTSTLAPFEDDDYTTHSAIMESLTQKSKAQEKEDDEDD